MNMNSTQNVEDYFSTHEEVSRRIDFSQIQFAANLIYNKILDGKNIFTMGNGGSAHNASHYITDWNKMANTSTGLKVKGTCLNDNMGLVTAFSNDLSFEEIFSGQLKILMNNEDLVIVVSGSGNSRNIIKALEYANENNATTLAFLGFDGGESIKIAQHHILVPSFDMQICEDIHLKIGHMIMKFLCKYEIRK